jgi:hypothetical protein
VKTADLGYVDRFHAKTHLEGLFLAKRNVCGKKETVRHILTVPPRGVDNLKILPVKK